MGDPACFSSPRARCVGSCLVGATLLLGMACSRSETHAPHPSESAGLPAEPTRAPIPNTTSGVAAASTREPGATSAPPAVVSEPKSKSGSSASSGPEHWPPRQASPGYRLRLDPVGAPRRDAQDVACDGRTVCRKLTERAAGRDASGQTMSVLELSLSAGPVSFEERFAGNCEPVELWLIKRRGGVITYAERLLELCNDGYGASGVGEDVIEVEDNHVYHRQYGGSAWRWGNSRKWQLFPRRIVDAMEMSHWTVGPSYLLSHWNWQSFSGHEAIEVPDCSVLDTVADPLALDPSRFSYAWLPIPVVTVPRQYAEEGWRNARLGRCSVRVGVERPDSKGEIEGFVTHGRHEGAKDATLRVVGISPTTLIVEVTDDRWVFDAPRTLFRDHLEVWTGPAPEESSERCERMPGEKPKQWGVQLEDGSVFGGFSSPDPTAVRVRRAKVGEALVFKLDFATPLRRVSVVYSDSDDGTRQKSLIATSRLSFGNSRSLGGLLRIDPDTAICAVHSGKLEPELE